MQAVISALAVEVPPGVSNCLIAANLLGGRDGQTVVAKTYLAAVFSVVGACQGVDVAAEIFRSFFEGYQQFQAQQAGESSPPKPRLVHNAASEQGGAQ